MIKNPGEHYAAAMQSDPVASPGLPAAEAPHGEPGVDATPDDHDGPEEEADAVLDLSRLTALLSRHGVTLACVAVIVASLIWKAEFISQFYFRQDDFKIYDMARSSGLSWAYLTQGYSGHFFPGVFAVTWILARVAFYNWAAASAVNLFFIGAASLAAWRLFRTLFGNRIEIVVPLILYVAAAIGFENYALWIVGIECVPLQLAVFAALNAHVQFIRTGRYRKAVAAAAWLAFGLIFDEKSVLIPLLVFAVTAGFLSPDRKLLTAVRTTAMRWWRVWAGYLAILAAYVVILVTSALSTMGTTLVQPTVDQIGTFAWHMISQSALPGFLGGPWQWLPNGNTGIAYAAPPELLMWLSVLAVVALLVAMVATRRKSWRAWAILAGWIVLADMLPVVLGRLVPQLSAALLGTETRYISDAAVVLAIAAGLAWLPMPTGDQRSATTSASEPPAPAPRRSQYFGRRWRIAMLDLTVVFVVGTVWSVHQLADVSGGPTSGAASRTYLANAREALAQTPAGTVIVNSLLPENIISSAFFGPYYSATRTVLGPLSDRGRQVAWQAAPAGYYSNLKIFGTDGRLYPALVGGTSTEPLTAGGCSPFKHGPLVLSFPATTPPGTAYLEIGYFAGVASAGQTVNVTYGSISRPMVLHPGLSLDFMPVSGSGTTVTIDDPLPGLCVSRALAGALGGSLGPPIPATSTSG
jgi:hypothetical protein